MIKAIEPTTLICLDNEGCEQLEVYRLYHALDVSEADRDGRISAILYKASDCEYTPITCAIKDNSLAIYKSESLGIDHSEALANCGVSVIF